MAKPEEIIHRGALIGLIEPQYPNASIRGGSASLPLAAMLRVHHLQQWDSLSDLAMEEALIEAPTILWFAGLDLIRDRIHDETTILTIHHLLERHELGEQLFKTVKDGLSARGITMLQSTIVDATVISAPCSIKNKERERGLKLNQTKNENQWDFGM